ncbi:MAG TPA: hypothetical protein VFE46_16075 [Pirellulales bacterium]|nr:hypothetical protein [Pirellulales bacterium]
MIGHCRFSRVSSALAIVAIFLLAGSPASGQDYEELPLYQANNKPVQAWSQLTSAALDDKTKSILGMLGGDPLDAAAFDQYFNDIVFPMFAQWKDVKIGTRTVSPLAEGINGVKLSDLRVRFKREFLNKATNPAAHEHLNDLTVKKMDQIASGNFHPVVRANALLMMGDLNDSESTGAPWKPALPYLWKYATAKNSIDAVRVPAWRGLVRFATQNGIDADHRQAAISAAVDALQKRNDLAGTTQDGKDWICCRAIDVLIALNNPPPNADVSKALLDTIKDNSTSMAIRTAAAGALATIKLNVPQNFDPAALAKTLGNIAVDDYKKELETAAAHNMPIVVGRLAQQLGDIRQGLVGSDGKGGVRAMSATADLQQYVDSLIGPLDNLIAACGTKQADPPTPTTPAYGGAPVVIPIDRQKPIEDALANAGNSLDAAVQRAAGGPAAPGTTAPATTPAQQPENPLGLN